MGFSRGLQRILCVAALFAISCGDESTTSVPTPDNNTSDMSPDSDVDSGELCPDACNDGDACTQDECVEGACVHTYDAAACCTDDQCEIDGACVDNGAPNPENSCEVCLVVSDDAAWTPKADAGGCDDGNACTSNDTCVDGVCVGQSFQCDDGNPCTDDTCDGAGGCMFANNTADCSDGDACTDGDTCVEGACVPGPGLSCDDSNPCTADSCDPTLGCTFVPDDGATCTDNSVCTEASVCLAGECVVQEVVSCDDNNLCTIDFCDAVDGCDHEDISDRCTDTNPCTDEACDPALGCVFPFNTDPCDDNNLCTTVDTCTSGACIGTPVNPDDGNPCTDDTCDPAVGVIHVNNTLACDDNNACTVGDTCADGGCQPGTQPLSCDDNNLCTSDSCDPATGCLNEDISDSCEDNNPCTVNFCDPDTGCGFTVVQSFTCRPTINITYPPRGATILGPIGNGITVTGTVDSGAGDITTFQINGQDVTPNQDGSFSLTLVPDAGANTLEFSASDELGTEEYRVQAFHYSSAFTNPTTSGQGNVNPGLGIYLAQDSIDDKQSPPPTDLAAIFKGVLDGFDLSSFFDSDTPIASNSGYDIYLTSLDFAGSTVILDAIDGGLRVRASLNQIEGGLFFDCTTIGCFFAGGDSNGGLDIDSIVITANLIITVNPDNTLAVSVNNPATSVNGLDIYSNNIWTNFLLGIIEPFIRGGLVSDLETELNTQLSTVLGPLLEDGLGALAFNQVFSLPRLDGNPPPIDIALESDFSFSDFQDASPGPQGGAFGLRAWATSTTRGTPNADPFNANLGVPMRVGCGAGQQMVIPKAAPLEIVFADDTINQILRAAWWGGLLQFPVDPALLGNVDLAQYGVTNLNMDVSGYLPPVATDCVNGELRLYIGDLRIDATLDLFGQPVNAEVYVAFDAPITLAANPNSGDIEIIIQAIENVKLEVNVTNEPALGVESALASLLETQLVPALGGLLGNGTPLASFPLPEIDLSASLGQPPGTSLIRIVPINDAGLPSSRQSGNTVIYGRLQ